MTHRPDTRRGIPLALVAGALLGAGAPFSKLFARAHGSAHAGRRPVHRACRSNWTCTARPRAWRWALRPSGPQGCSAACCCHPCRNHCCADSPHVGRPALQRVCGVTDAEHGGNRNGSHRGGVLPRARVPLSVGCCVLHDGDRCPGHRHERRWRFITARRAAYHGFLRAWASRRISFRRSRITTRFLLRSSSVCLRPCS